MTRFVRFFVLFAASAPSFLFAEWRVTSPHDGRQTSPPKDAFAGEAIEPGAAWPQDDKFRWLIGDLAIPETIAGIRTRGKAIGLRINCGDGGEVWVDGVLESRFDNDHPALVLAASAAQPGRKVRIDVQVYGRVQGGDRFSEADWVILEDARAKEPVRLRVHPDITGERVPDGIAGLSQGGGLADYEDATAAKLREGGFRWFRMDNVFTPVVRASDGELVYDWTDFDRRVDFVERKLGADLILAASYMPIPFDAVKNDDRQSAPRDYALWEDLCYRAAKRCVDRGVPIPFWEVWNEVNTGWLKPGPEDSGAEKYRRIYKEARGRDDVDEEAVRRFEAYCKLYAATARGVHRADPDAKIGGPALASGPFEHEECGHCFHGKGFAKGLMLFCREEKLPLDFVSWHEYFQPEDVFVREVRAFRDYLRDVPEIRDQVGSFMVTEWNEAWWMNRPMDHEVGAAWAAASITRAFIPERIDRPCFFYVKQNDSTFRGDFSLLMAGNVPKPSFNVLRIFNHLRGRWVRVSGTDDDVSAVAAWDEEARRLAIVLVNFRYRYGLRREVELGLDLLPAALRGGRWRVWVVDATHSNVWHDRELADLDLTEEGAISPEPFRFRRTLLANSVVLVELLGEGGPAE